MRLVIQRVSSASVTVDQQVVGAIGYGLLILVGVEQEDQMRDVSYLAEKTLGLRVFEDELGKMNLSAIDRKADLLAVSQFTLLGDARKGRRPSFIDAAQPDEANRLYEAYCQLLENRAGEVQRGVFQADMQVQLINDGPVTILLDSRKRF